MRHGLRHSKHASANNCGPLEAIHSRYQEFLTCVDEVDNAAAPASLSDYPGILSMASVNVSYRTLACGRELYLRALVAELALLGLAIWFSTFRPIAE